MAQYTNFFTVYEELQERGLEGATPVLKEEVSYSEEDLQKSLESTLSCIKTLDDYTILIDVIESLQDQITLRFLYIFFQALGGVEERIWASAGMHPPIRKIIDDNLDLLLDEYTEFVLRLDRDIVAWAKHEGYFEMDDKYEFMKRRNSIYGRYAVIAGKIINACS